MGEFFGGLLVLAIIALVIYADYLIANTFYSIAIEKGYSDRKYFWYSFILGLIGYCMVIALPYKQTEKKQYTEELPEL